MHTRKQYLPSILKRVVQFGILHGLHQTFVCFYWYISRMEFKIKEAHALKERVLTDTLMQLAVSSSYFRLSRWPLHERKKKLYGIRLVVISRIHLR